MGHFLFELKDIAKKALLDLNDNQLQSQINVSSIKIKLDQIPFDKVLNTLSCDKINYLKNKEGTFEILGIGKLIEWTNQFFGKEVKNLTQHNPDLYILGHQNFFPYQKNENEWKKFNNYQYTLPILTLVKNKDGSFLIINIQNEIVKNQIEFNNFTNSINSLLNRKIKKNIPTTTGQTSNFPEIDKWQEMITNATNLLTSTNLDKIVLARKKIINQSNLDSNSVFLDLKRKEKKNSYNVYAKIDDKNSFISFTPERLFKLEEGILKTEALAGTRPLGANDEEELFYEAELKNSSKEKLEHQLVINDITNKLLNVSSSIQTFETKIRKLNKVQHLETKIQATLDEDVEVNQLIKSLHPTTAVGGTPWVKAEKTILDLEPFSRGIYAAPIGVISKNYTEFVVGIRSALIHGDSIHIYGGAGIMPESTPLEEWDETEAKMHHFLNL